MDRFSQLLQFPYSALLAVFFLLLVYVVHRYVGENRWVKKLASASAARILLAIGAVLFALEGTWSIPVHTSVWFASYLLTLLTSLGLTVLNGVRKKKRAGFLLNHLGLFVIVWASFFGSPDVQRSKMMVLKGSSEMRLSADDGLTIMLPFDVELKDFKVDYYDDGVSPRQFTSNLVVGGEEMQTSVNVPCSYEGYSIFQEGYDPAEGRYTILLLVKDPWLPIVYLGMILLAAGSVMLLFGKWRAKIVVPITVLLTMLFTGLTVARINFGTMMPALRSWWFVPHLFIYMVAYSLMAFALVMWIYESIKHRDSKGDKAKLIISDALARSSSALLVIGMLTGSVWARQAWGDYWAWDAKENWAAVTWLIILMHLHLQHKRGWAAISILILAFMALQITWYGVDYLPSAANSLHTYTK